MMSERYDDDLAWPVRPWILAALCGGAALIFHALVDVHGGGNASPPRQALATFVVIATLAFSVTVEQRRWTWAAAFALLWGAVVGLVGWSTAGYNRFGEIAEFPFLSGLLAVLIAAPLFQAARDEGGWRFPYARLHRHAWTDAVIGAASILFVGISFLLAFLVAGLFDLIGIDALKRLLDKGWFGFLLAGTAFGGALGLLRERDAPVTALQRLVMVVLSVLAPILAASLILFLLSLPFTGLAGLWASSVPTTPLMLVAAAGAVLLVNVVIGNGADDRSTNRVLRGSAIALLPCILPLALIAAVSIGQRIDQHGWTPERIWGVIAVAVACAYGVAALIALVRGRAAFDDHLRPAQTNMALGLCGLALFLALPILDFGAISARSQVDRLASGRIKPAEFDWAAMAFDFGPAGRARLAEMARSGPVPQRRLAGAALASEQRYRVDEQIAVAADAETLGERLRIVPAGQRIDPALGRAIAATRYCRTGPCVATPLEAERWLLIGSYGSEPAQSVFIERQRDGSWSEVTDFPVMAQSPKPAPKPDLRRARIEVRAVERRQLYVDGRPVGTPFE